MDQRYKKINSNIQKSYNPTCPVEIADGALLYDNQTLKILLQLKFFNISSSTITSIFTKIICYDAAGDLVENDSTTKQLFSELRLKAKDTFANKTPVILNSITRNVKVIIEKVVFNNGEIWRNDGQEVSDPILQPLRELGNDLYDQFIREVEILPRKNDYKYIPEIHDLKWFCSCGRINDMKNSECLRCGISKKWIFDHVKIDLLKENLSKYNEELRISEEQRQYKLEFERKKNTEEFEERKRIEAANKALEIERSKRTRKILIRSVIILIPIIVIGTYYYINLLKPNLEYNKALSLYEENKHQEAITILENLGDFNDSSQFKEEIKLDSIYFEAKNNYNASNYFEAIKGFNKVLNYKDSTELILKTKYDFAKILYVKEEYLKAMMYFEDLKDSYDVEKEYEDTIYKYAIQLYEEKQFYKAREYFNLVSDSRDTNKYLNSYYYEIEGIWKETMYDNKTYEFKLRKDGTLSLTEIETGEIDIVEWTDEEYVYNQGIVVNLYKIVKVNKRKGGQLVIDWLRYSDRDWKRIFDFVSELN